MLWLRVFGILVVVGITPAVTGASVVPIIAGVTCLGLVVAFQVVGLRDGRQESVRGMAIVGLAGDSVAAYLIGQAFIASAEWAHFAACPLLAMDAAVVLGSAGAAASTLASGGRLPRPVQRAGLDGACVVARARGRGPRRLCHLRRLQRHLCQRLEADAR
jgi:hypothetical protein